MRFHFMLFKILVWQFPEWRTSYPSGRLAILICAVNAVDFTYVILADKALPSAIPSIFPSPGQSPCYHPNGLIWYVLSRQADA